MGEVQNVSTLPDNPTLSQIDNDEASYESDFRFTRGANHGLGSVYIYVSYQGPMKTGASYPGYDKFSDEGGKASKGNVIYYIEPDDAADAQADWFCQNHAEGLTQAGLSRINQFVYCVLGAQINVRSSILG